MKPAPFEYVRPESLDEAVDALARYGADAAVLAGGQSLLALMAHRRATPKVLVDINFLGGNLGELAVVDGRLRIGALVRHRAFESDPGVARAFPVLRHAAFHIGNSEVRNRGTFCGSLAFADPAAEWPLLAVALGARLKLRSALGERWIEAEAFSGVRTPDELLCEVSIDAPAGFTHFDEIAPRHTAPALASLGMIEAGEGLRLVAGAVTAAPTVLVETASVLAAGEAWADVAAALENELTERIVVPDPKYRLHLVKTLLQRAMVRYQEDAVFAPA